MASDVPIISGSTYIDHGAMGHTFDADLNCMGCHVSWEDLNSEPEQCANVFELNGKDDVDDRGLVFAVDPGTEKSGYVVLDADMNLKAGGVVSNDDILYLLACEGIDRPNTTLVLERLSSYGMRAGRTMFETAEWTGRFAQSWEGAVRYLYRHEIKKHVCKNTKAKKRGDKEVREALVERFCEIHGLPDAKALRGTAKNRGPLFGVSTHAWAALAVCVTFIDKELNGE